MSGSVSVSGGSGNDANFYITGPAGAKIYNAGRISGGTTFAFTADTSGAHVLHFDNSYSIVDEKYVTVSYKIDVTLIPGVSPAISYAIVAATVVLVPALLFVSMSVLCGRRRNKAQPPVPQSSMPQPS